MQPRSQPKHIRRAAILTTFAAVLLLAVTARADDDDIVNAAGFEPNPPFGFSTVFLGTGQLEGQVNPPGEGQVIPPGQWLRTPGGTSSAVVQSTVFAPGGGNQAVRVDRAANDNSRWAVPVNHLGYPDFPSPPPPEPPQPLIHIVWDMRVQQPAGPANTFGPYFGVEAYDDDGSSVGLLGSLGVDATTGAVLFQAANTGFLTPTGSTVASGTWHRYGVELDYSTHVYRFFLDGVLLGSAGFVDHNNVPGGLNDFSDADISALAAAGDAGSQALTGTAYFDNFLVREGAIPEPASAGALLLFAAAVRRRSRLS